jgi:hypothetical protein
LTTGVELSFWVSVPCGTALGLLPWWTPSLWGSSNSKPLWLYWNMWEMSCVCDFTAPQPSAKSTTYSISCPLVSLHKRHHSSLFIDEEIAADWAQSESWPEPLSCDYALLLSCILDLVTEKIYGIDFSNTMDWIWNSSSTQDAIEKYHKQGVL